MPSMNPIKGVYIKKPKATGYSAISKPKPSGLNIPSDYIPSGAFSSYTTPNAKLLVGNLLFNPNLAYIYSNKSRVMKGTENMLAVKLKDGTKGWLTNEGQFIGQDNEYKMLYSLDRTLVGAGSGVSLSELYLKMTPSQRAKFVDEIKEFDWERFWNEDYKSGDDDYQIEVFFGILEIIEEITGTR